MHVLPQLRKLEDKYRNELAVIGVHSAKFPTERDTASVHQAIRRYEIRHPVVNDHEFQVWHQFGIKAWPTLMFLDPQGRIIGSIAGEASFERLDGILSEMIAEFDEKGMLNLNPLNLSAGADAVGERALSFPGNLIADEASGRLFIADSNHNRIIVASLEGAVQAVIGSGEQGLLDGDFSSAQLNRPQGLALAGGETLYVADTESHAIRRISLGESTVETIAGSGSQATEFHMGGNGREVDLNSPWDVAQHGRDGCNIAMAGFHHTMGDGPVHRRDTSHRRHGPRGPSRRDSGVRLAGPAQRYYRGRRDTLLCRQRDQFQSG